MADKRTVFAVLPRFMDVSSLSKVPTVGIKVLRGLQVVGKGKAYLSSVLVVSDVAQRGVSCGNGCVE